MKFHLTQINKLLKLIAQGQIKAILFYGPDKGYIDKICSTIIKKFNLLQICIEYSELKVQSLEILLNTQNFFMKQEFIKVRSITSSIDSTLKTALSKDFVHLIAFIADELPPNVITRKFFETEPYLASVACYYDDPLKIKQIILFYCTRFSKTITEDALLHIQSYLTGDHQLICNEINKLLHFTFDKDQITLNDVQCVLSSNLITNIDDLCIYLTEKDLGNFLRVLTKLTEQNTNALLIIRALIRYYMNLYIVLSKTANNGNIDDIIKTLSPPIFYKYINAFKKAANKLTIKDCIKMLSLLQQAEIDYKLRPNSFDLYQQVYCTTLF